MDHKVTATHKTILKAFDFTEANVKYHAEQISRESGKAGIRKVWMGFKKISLVNGRAFLYGKHGWELQTAAMKLMWF